MYYLELLRASEGTLSRWSRLHLQSLAPTNPLWACVVGYGPFSLCVSIRKACTSAVSINRLMMLVKDKELHWIFIGKTNNYARPTSLTAAIHTPWKHNLKGIQCLVTLE
jgi:hypothetical protein